MAEKRKQEARLELSQDQMSSHLIMRRTGSQRVGNNLVFAFLKLQIRSFTPVQVCVKIVRDKRCIHIFILNMTLRCTYVLLHISIKI